MNPPVTTDAGLVFELSKVDWRQTRFSGGPVRELAPGQVLHRVDRFALAFQVKQRGRARAIGLTSAVHRHSGDELEYDCTIGATHWSAGRTRPRGTSPRS